MSSREKMMALTQQNKYVQSRLMLAQEQERQNELFEKLITELEIRLGENLEIQLQIELSKGDIENDKAILQQNKAGQNMVILTEEQKKVKELYDIKVQELEAQIQMSHALQLQIENLRAAIGVLNHMDDEEDMELIEEELRAYEEELESLIRTNEEY